MDKPNTTQVRITKNLRDIIVGEITETRDINGNQKYFAESFMKDRQDALDFSFTFWTPGGAKLWLELVGQNSKS